MDIPLLMVEQVITTFFIEDTCKSSEKSDCEISFWWQGLFYSLVSMATPA